MTDIHPSSWDELLNELFERSWRPDIGHFRSPYVFRGTGKCAYQLSSSLARLGGDRELEEHIVRAFRRYAYSPDLHDYSIWNWLALGQHHGLSTRLLDWTYSPFVAMHFATENPHHYDTDGVIWAIHHVKTNRLLPQKLRDILEDEGTAVFSAEMLDRAAASLSAFDRLSDQPFVSFFEPPSLDARIVNQYALFSLMSDPAARLDEWLQEHPDMYRRVIVPAKLKREIRDKLDNANITERVLYPGLDGLSRWLNRYYARVAPVDETEVD
jgi:hypothetical protein